MPKFLGYLILAGLLIFQTGLVTAQPEAVNRQTLLLKLGQLPLAAKSNKAQHPRQPVSLKAKILEEGEISLLKQVFAFDDLQEFSLSELILLEQTILAKAGYRFRAPALQNHFRRFSWYQPRYEHVYDHLTPIDRKNRKTISRMKYFHRNNYPPKSAEVTIRLVAAGQKKALFYGLAPGTKTLELTFAREVDQKSVEKTVGRNFSSPRTLTPNKSRLAYQWLSPRVVQVTIPELAADANGDLLIDFAEARFADGSSLGAKVLFNLGVNPRLYEIDTGKKTVRELATTDNNHAPNTPLISYPADLRWQEIKIFPQNQLVIGTQVLGFSKRNLFTSLSYYSIKEQKSGSFGEETWLATDNEIPGYFLLNGSIYQSSGAFLAQLTFPHRVNILAERFSPDGTRICVVAQMIDEEQGPLLVGLFDNQGKFLKSHSLPNDFYYLAPAQDYFYYNLPLRFTWSDDQQSILLEHRSQQAVYRINLGTGQATLLAANSYHPVSIGEEQILLLKRTGDFQVVNDTGQVIETLPVPIITPSEIAEFKDYWGYLTNYYYTNGLVIFANRQGEVIIYDLLQKQKERVVLGKQGRIVGVGAEKVYVLVE